MTGRVCQLHLPALGLPARTAVLVERDRRRYEFEAEIVAGADPLLHIDPPADAPRVLMDDRLVEVLRSAPTDDGSAAAAAFVAGRCTAGDEEADAAIVEALRWALGTVDTSKALGSTAGLFVEAVMSLALHGDVERAVELFTTQLTHPTRRSMADSLMAGYLAQLGNTVGYPILVEELHDPDSGQLRRNAVEQLVAFVAYDGQAAGDTVIDVNRALDEASRDPSRAVVQQVELVRIELGLVAQ